MLNSDIFVLVIYELDQILVSGLSLEDVIINFRGSLVLFGYILYFFWSNIIEFCFYKFCLIVVMYIFCKRVVEFKLQGVDFIFYFYVFEVVFVMCLVYYDRVDYNYFFRRIVEYLRNGGYSVLNCELFFDVLVDFLSGLIYVVLVGK